MDKKIKGYVKDRLDPRVMTAVLVVGIIEFELFTFSGPVVAAAREDAWLSSVLGSLIVLVTSYLLVLLASRFPRENYFQYLDRIWGKPLAFLITAAYLIFWAVFLTVLIKELGTANQAFYLRETPELIPKLLVALGAAALVSYGFPVFVRYCQLMFPFIMLPLFLIFVLLIPNIEVKNFLPVLDGGILPVLKGALIYAGAIQGPLGIILFLSPFVNTPRACLAPVLTGIIIINLVALAQMTTAIGILGVESAIKSIWGGVATMGSVELPGFPVERFELGITLPWLIGVFTTCGLFLYLLTYGLMQVFNLRNKRAVISAAAALVLAVGHYIPDYAWTMTLRTYIAYATPLFVIAIPVFTLAVAALRGQRGEQS